MSRDNLNVPISDAELTSEWLGAAMGVDGVDIEELERLFLNNPVISQIFRAHISFGGGMTTVIVKIPAQREDNRRMIAGERMFERELVTYELLEKWQGGFVPRLLGHAWNPEEQTAALVFEDLGSPFAGEEAGQVSIDSAEIALERLADVHGAFWGGDSLREYGWVRPAETSDLFSEPVEEFRPAWRNMLASGRVPVGQNALRLGERLVIELGDVMDRLHKRPQTLVHADLHQANLMFRHGDPTDPVVIDWGNTASCGATSDLAKFLATSLNAGVLAEHEESLMRTYHEALMEFSSNPFPLWGKVRKGADDNPLSPVGVGQGDGELAQSQRSAITYTLEQLTTDYHLAQLATLANYVIANFSEGGNLDEPETSSPSLRAVLAAVDATGVIPEG